MKQLIDIEALNKVAAGISTQISTSINIEKEQKRAMAAESALATDITKLKDADSDIYTRLRGVNLLDNWYFCNPINQRQQTKYSVLHGQTSAQQYSIDRWRLRGDSEFEPKSDCSRLSVVGQTDIPAICQSIDNFEQRVLGKTLTASALIKDMQGEWGLLVSYGNGSNLLTSIGSRAVAIPNPGLHSFTFTYPETISYTNVNFSFRCYNGNVGDYIDIVAAKFELGDKQTLAHNEGTVDEPKWVLNDPPPNYATELAKCQYYQRVFRYTTDNGDNVFNAVGAKSTSAVDKLIWTFPISMRIMPKIVNPENITIRRNDTNVVMTTTSIETTAADFLGTVNVVATIDTTKTPIDSMITYRLNMKGKTSVIFDANL